MPGNGRKAPNGALTTIQINAVFSAVCFVLSLVSTSASDCLERLVSEMTHYVLNGT